MNRGIDEYSVGFGKNEASPDGKPILGHREEVTGKKARMKQRK